MAKLFKFRKGYNYELCHIHRLVLKTNCAIESNYWWAMGWEWETAHLFHFLLLDHTSFLGCNYTTCERNHIIKYIFCSCINLSWKNYTRLISITFVRFPQQGAFQVWKSYFPYFAACMIAVREGIQPHLESTRLGEWLLFRVQSVQHMFLLPLWKSSLAHCVLLNHCCCSKYF